MDKEILIYGGLILLAVIIVVSIIKKAIKLVITIAAIILLISAYNILVKGVSPIDEFTAYKTNIQYGKDIKSYNSKINVSVSKIKDILENKKTDETSLNTLQSESTKLRQYQKEVQELKHTEKLNLFHNKYCDYLNTIVATTDSAAKLATVGNKTLQGAEEVLSKLKTGIENLVSLKLR